MQDIRANRNKEQGELAKFDQPGPGWADCYLFQGSVGLQTGIAFVESTMGRNTES